MKLASILLSRHVLAGELLHYGDNVFFWKFLSNASSKKKKCSNKILRKNHQIFNPKKKKPPPEFTLLL
jgi:hypothetical protein